jgi:hypothetical protein
MEGTSRHGHKWGEGELRVELTCDEDRPRAHNGVMKGDSKYPWADVPIGGAMQVKRMLGTVKQACRRWCRQHKGFKFVIWRKADGWVVAKRVK